jgi:hypothetical protein
MSVIIFYSRGIRILTRYMRGCQAVCKKYLITTHSISVIRKVTKNSPLQSHYSSFARRISVHPGVTEDSNGHPGALVTGILVSGMPPLLL